MPMYTYECLVEAGGCSQVFREFRPMHARQNVLCPNCMNDGNETFVDALGNTRHRVEAQMPKVQVISDVDHQDGRTGDRIPMPTYGPGVSVGSRRELKELRERARESYEKETGIDPGPIDHVDKREEHHVVSPFDPTKTHEEHYAELKKRVVTPVEDMT